MARIPEAEVERIKCEVSIVRLVQAEGIELRGSGDNLMGRCPWHKDRTPSLSVSPSKNLWHCHGACQEGGDVIAWVRKARGVSFAHAVELLRADFPSFAAGAPGQGKAARMLKPLVERTTEDAEALRQVVGYYHETLKQSPQALVYLQEKRGLVSVEMVDHFQLGYSNRTLGYRLPSPDTAAGEAVRGRLKELGLLSARGFEHFTGSVTVPILGLAGEVLGMYGRKIAEAGSFAKGTPMHLYLKGQHRGVFNEAALGASESVILCEAILDALTFWCAGFRNVTASYGVGGFTPLHLQAFKRHGVKQVFIAYDRDDAGDKAAEALAEQLLGERFECFRVQFPRGMDANEYALRTGPPSESLDAVLRHAVWLGKMKTVAIASKPASEAIEQTPIAEASGAAAERIEPQLVAKASPVEPTEPLAEERSPVAPVHAGAVGVELAGEEVRIAVGDRHYRVRGLGRNLSFDQLRVNLLAGRAEAFHVDTLDLYAAKQRSAFVKQAAFEMKLDEELLARDLKHVLREVERLQDEIVKKTLEPKEPARVTLSEADEKAALELLKDEHLVERILSDFEACGVVGEETNKLVGYLALVSRLLEEPLAIIVQSSSAAGKTALMEGELSFVPEEARVKYSAMTGQSLFYMGGTDLKHKVLAIVEEAGAQKASYALKLLQSEGELTIASTGKDPHTGRLVTQEYRVEGPVMIFLTTTAVEVDEELLNRCLVLTVDEERSQTRAIHEQQREKQTLEGLLKRKDRSALLKLHQDAQRLLKPLLVANPYARQLTFMDDRTRTRRDHVKYLTLIRSIALLHQHQRELKAVEHRGEVVPYIEVTLGDIVLANRLAHQVLGRSLDDLAPQTRRLLMAVDAMAAEACAAQQLERGDWRFTRRQVRERLGWGNTQLKVHLHRLEEMEYVLVHRAERGGFEYELVYDGKGKDGQPFLCGLLDPSVLTGRSGERSGPEAERSALAEPRSGSGRASVGGRSGGGRPRPEQLSLATGAGAVDPGSNGNGNAHPGSVSAEAGLVTGAPVTSVS